MNEPPRRCRNEFQCDPKGDCLESPSIGGCETPCGCEISEMTSDGPLSQGFTYSCKRGERMHPGRTKAAMADLIAQAAA